MLTQQNQTMQAVVAQNVVTMSSREIAELCDKRHPDVRRDIRGMLDTLGEDVSSFAHTYLDAAGRQQEEYLLPKDLTLTLIAGYNVILRKRIIDRLQELESRPVFSLPDFTNPVEAARAWADQVELKQIANQKLLEAAPKVQFFDTVVQRTNLMNATQVGQKLGLSAMKLNKALDELDVYHAGVKRGRVFKQWFIDKGYGELKQTEQGFPQPLFTPAGEAWVVERLISEGYEVRRVA